MKWQRLLTWGILATVLFISIYRQNSAETEIPVYVLEVLEEVRSTGEAPDGYVGGRTFHNREKRLPKNEAGGKKIKYREWDVHPKVKGKNRGAERLVTGSDDSAYYTKDHYDSFIQIE